MIGAIQNRDVVISKTPLRVSFLGGGSDTPAFYRKMAGGVVSTAIDKFVYIVAKRRTDDRIRLITHSEQTYPDWQQIGDPIHRAVFQHLQWEGGIDISIMSDVTAHGSGLGASSAVVVGLLNALMRLNNTIVDPQELAACAAHVEMNIASRDIGKQDAYPPAYGDIRHYRFLSDDSVNSHELKVPADVREELSSWLMLLDSGYRRDAAATLSSQKILLPQDAREQIISRMVEQAAAMASDIENGVLANIAEYFEEAWQLKKSLGALQGHSELSDIYHTAKECGVLGAKILGAGGGGFFLFLAPPDTHKRLGETFAKQSLHKVSIYSGGSRTNVFA